MGATVVERQGDLGLVARLALQYACEVGGGYVTSQATEAVGRLVPLLSEADIRLLLSVADRALSDETQDHKPWADLMLTLRRVG